jgi:predicted RNA-binding Zn-ribbon protein involved in translation (DUF1610 family)
LRHRPPFWYSLFAATRFRANSLLPRAGDFVADERGSNMSDKVQFSCPHCGQAYVFAIEQLTRSAGKMAPCRKCGQSFPIPSPAMASSAVGVGATAAPPPPPSAPPPYTPPAPAAPSAQAVASAAAEPGIPAGAMPQFSAARTLDYVSRGGADSQELRFEGSMTPQIQLIDGEVVIDTFEAGALDLGLIGRLIGYKRRLVLTTHRIFRFDKKLIENSLEVVWLQSVKSAFVGQSINPIAAIIGGMAALYGMILFFGALFSRFGSVFSFDGVLGVILMAIGLLIIAKARVKAMFVTTGHDKTGLKLTRLRPEESQRFIDAVFRELQRRSTGN